MRQPSSPLRFPFAGCLLLLASLLAVAGCRDEHSLGKLNGDKQPAKGEVGVSSNSPEVKTPEVETIADGPKTVGDETPAGTTGTNKLSPDSDVFAEPAGIGYARGKLYVADTNNHQIRTVDLATHQVQTLHIAGLKPPLLPPEPQRVAEAKTEVENNDDAAAGAEQPHEAPDNSAENSNPRTAAVRAPVPPTEEATATDSPAEEAAGEEAGEEDLAGLKPAHPFPNSVEIPFDFPEDMEWLNTEKPLKLSELRGKFVILDFWTYCCINCIHILPELKKLERMYPNNLVVIGVHSAKFETEKGTDNIKDAILRYEIEHPVVNDHEHKIWDMFGTDAWPTIVIIDPEGKFLGRVGGEIQAEPFKRVFEAALPYYRDQKLLNEKPIHFELLRDKQDSNPLHFPGKVLADEASNRLFIADSNHNRIVVATLDGQLIDTIGSGAIGQDDGDFAAATFNKPQGMALQGDMLYVADTENHLLRKIDLQAKSVKTIAGTGVQGRNAWPGMDHVTPFADPPEKFAAKPSEFAINSPWDLWIHGKNLYIAMAGPHQIWKMKLDESEIGPYAGNGREDIVDGPLMPRMPHALGFSSFAQPSGLASDGTWLYVADSEGSSIRAVPFNPKEHVKTIIGTAHLDRGRLFDFGHIDGVGEDVRLQHALGVVHHEGKLYIADTYNSAIKEIDLATKHCRTIAGPPPANAEELEAAAAEAAKKEAQKNDPLFKDIEK